MKQQSNKANWSNRDQGKALPSTLGKRPYQNLKGIGPNKACGHKGGISRQGSKRG